jgi:hypothetical protein
LKISNRNEWQRQALSLKVNDIMMKGCGKIKAKMNFAR